MCVVRSAEIHTGGGAGGDSRGGDTSSRFHSHISSTHHINYFDYFELEN